MNGTAVATSFSHGCTLKGIAAEVASLLASVGLDEFAGAARMEALRVADAVCTVAVVGEFKRGKSTLINALIGADLLPVGALPLTAVGTRAQFGEAVRAVVEFLDGRRVEVTPAAIADYVTERANPGNTRGVATVTATIPARVLRTPLQLVDTPGIGSAFADVTAMAREWLTRADIVVVVLSAEQPASRHELDAVRELVSAGMPTFVVENKIDLVSPVERSDVLAFMQEQIDNASGREVRLFPLSAAQARRAQRTAHQTALRESGAPALEEALIEFVRQNGARVLAQGCRRRLLGLIDSALARLELQRRAGPVTRRWQEERRVTMQRRVDVALFCDMRDANVRLASATRELIFTLSLAASESALVRRLESAIDRLPVWRRGQSMRSWAAEVEAYVTGACDAVLNCWSATEQQTLASATADLTAAWPARGRDLLTPILGEFQPPPPPPIEFQPPAVDISLPQLRAGVLPGAVGRWQLRRRVWRWMRAVLGDALGARRTAIDASVAAALRRADGDYRQRLDEMARRIIAEATIKPPPDATGYDAVTRALRKLRVALLEERDGP
jgi:small GTP-binding protein